MPPITPPTHSEQQAISQLLLMRRMHCDARTQLWKPRFWMMPESMFLELLAELDPFAVYPGTADADEPPRVMGLPVKHKDTYRELLLSCDQEGDAPILQHYVVLREGSPVCVRE